MSGPLAAFYGDDFTGSAENLAQFCRHGLRGRLYFSPDALQADLAAAQDLDVVGLAGTARALGGRDMDAELDPAFAALRDLNAQVVQYKICSTFDSAPERGSFGRAMARARAAWPGCALPVFAAVPGFGRYTAFATHFVDGEQGVQRLDRYPPMAEHPSTPMREADLRQHLAAQTDLEPAAVMLTDYANADGGAARFQRAAEGPGYVVCDAVTGDHQTRVADLVRAAAHARPVVAIAAQGLADGLGGLHAADRSAPARAPVATQDPGTDRLLVLSGSLSSQTDRQLDAFERAGGTVVAFPLDRAHDTGAVAEELFQEVRDRLARGDDVAVATSAARTSDPRTSNGAPSDPNALARNVGRVYAALAQRARVELGLSRIVVAGGDTSSYAVRGLGADALEIAVFDAAANGHVCRLRARDARLDGLELILKGGQVGGRDFLVRARTGNAQPTGGSP